MEGWRRRVVFASVMAKEVLTMAGKDIFMGSEDTTLGY